MTLKWAIKELITAVKLNNMCVRRLTTAEQQSTIDSERSAGSVFWNDDDNKLEVYHSGTGSEFSVQSVSNFLFRQTEEIGITGGLQTILSERFVNKKGVMNNRVIVSVDYTPLAGSGGFIEVEIIDGVQRSISNDLFPAQSSLARVKKDFELATNLFQTDTDMQIIIRGSRVRVRDIVIRGV